jgi:hypothetical protein
LRRGSTICYISSASQARFADTIDRIRRKNPMGANHSGERRKSRMKRSKRNLVTQEQAAVAQSAKKRKKKA